MLVFDSRSKKMLTIGDGFVCHEVTVLLIIVIGILFIFSYYYASGLDPFSFPHFDVESSPPKTHCCGAIFWGKKKNHEITENH